MFSELAFSIFNESIEKYHLKDDVYQVFENPYSKDEIKHLLYRKNWIDTVQWHYEDIIRNPEIDPQKALVLKRKIDASNQDRTDLVEFIDSYFLNKYQSVDVKPTATINTESPAWAIDRLSILALKIYHMNEETYRSDASNDHKQKCQTKLNILLEQKKDLSLAIDQLLADKMYNDEELNPILRGK